MEPRPHERGNGVSDPNAIQAAARFNGATSSRTWKRQRELSACENSRSFNGATSSRTWKHRKARVVKRAALFASMEPRPHERGNKTKVVTSATRALASMEPRPHERGNDDAEADSQRVTAASMEPRPHERGNFTVARLGRRLLPASMEPRPHERGNPLGAGQGVTNALGLQWSHVLTNVETRQCTPRSCRAYKCFNGATSSRTWKRRRRGPAPPERAPASMEPRPHERGNGALCRLHRFGSL